MKIIKHLKRLDQEALQNKEYELHIYLDYVITLIEEYYSKKEYEKQRQRRINSLLFVCKKRRKLK